MHRSDIGVIISPTTEPRCIFQLRIAAHCTFKQSKTPHFQTMPLIEFHKQSLLSENKTHHTATLRTLHGALTALTSSHHRTLFTIAQRRPVTLSKLLAVRERAKYERLQEELRQELTSAHLAYTERRADLLQQPANMSREFVATRRTRGVIFSFSALRARLSEVEDKNEKLRQDRVKWEEAHGELLVVNRELEGALGKERKKNKTYREEARSSAAELKRCRGMLADANSKLIAQNRLVELIENRLGSELAVARGERGKLERVERVLIEVKARAGHGIE